MTSPTNPSGELTTDEWRSLWHLLCAHLAELRGDANRLNAKVEGWGDQRLGASIADLEKFVRVAHRNAGSP